ncbi:unnamed protein product [Cuscuta campestris]|uniref:Uncharacterized protein n=1 Tax=Cuscuta campestris TaxID=132261 RepID=A0A484M7J4_9ASTE|nr:unnamed protein product [Cuscuta campestris]
MRENPKLTNAFKASKESSSEESSESSNDSSDSSSSEESNDEEDEEKAMRMKYTDFLKWKKYVKRKEVYSKPKKERHKPSEESSESSNDSSDSSSSEESNDEEDEEKAMRMKYTDFLKWKKYVKRKEVYSKPKKERHKPRYNKNPLRFGLSSEDKRKLSMNAKAINILHCSLGPDEFARVCSCKTAKEVWDLLQATHEGDISTKQTMIALGNSEYESFKKGSSETIQDMNKRFNEIVNKLKWHSSIVDLLPKCDKAETAHIWSSLYSHELLLRKIKEEEMRENPKLTNAFKASKESSSEESSESSNDSSDSSSSEESNDEEDEEKAMRMKYTDFLKWKKYVKRKEVYSKPKKERHKPSIKKGEIVSLGLLSLMF